MGPAQTAIHYARANRWRFVNELREFVAFPSVSAQREHASDVRDCAQWLARHLYRIGLGNAGVVETRGHPLVYAEDRRADTAPALLVYGHYDVHPPGSIGEWRTHPFRPTVRGLHLYGRGVSDNKGQLFAHVKALEAYLRTSGSLPLNVMCIFDGEEEIGSPNVDDFLIRNRDRLAADVAVVSDTRMRGPGRPAITHALRGVLDLELEVRGPEQGRHVAVHGPAVERPLHALSKIIAGLHRPDGRVAVAGFYDRVRLWRPAERAYMGHVGPTDAELLATPGPRYASREPGYSLYERTTIRPALVVTDIATHPSTPNAETALPARATAKLCVRLVPHQDPWEAEQMLRRHIARVAPASVRAIVRALARTAPVLVDCHPEAIRAAAAAYRKGFGSRPVLMRSGGSIPVVDSLRRILEIPTVPMGFALLTDRAHAPNERFHVPTFHRAIATCIWFLAELPRPAARCSDVRRKGLAGASHLRASGEPPVVSRSSVG